MVFDKDNTLTDHDSSIVRPDLMAPLEKAISTFGEHNVAVLSNNKSSLLNHRVRLLKGGPLAKPFCAEAVANALKADQRRVAIVGDRLATDMVLGHLMGGVSVLVLPWKTDNEQPGLKTARAIENFVWQRMLESRLAPHDHEVIKKLQVSARFP